MQAATLLATHSRCFKSGPHRYQLWGGGGGGGGEDISDWTAVGNRPVCWTHRERETKRGRE